ncbi:hypothetical protein [Coralliovum pocilloporae]|uniref:hypothetical protein n=1 Tax=Coralliovum pocilloporae TaxID=3066369 RepID=UPI0033079215
MSGTRYDGFFIGWSKKLPKGLQVFLPAFAMLLIGLFAGVAYSVAVTQDDPGDGRFAFNLGRQTVVGVLEADPYPTIRIPPNETYPDGHTMMLSGPGKRGVAKQARALDGRVVHATGVLLQRGDLDMLQVNGGRLRLATAVSEDPAQMPEDLMTAQNLGRWRLTGEICDGKCYVGAMRPGSGLAHKACANLCLTGGIPPVFVTTGPVEGQTFFLLGDKDGKALTDRITDLTALLIKAEGEIERRGDLLVFKMDLETVKVQ